jgi:hypothetical protein
MHEKQKKGLPLEIFSTPLTPFKESMKKQQVTPTFKSVNIIFVKK